MATKVIILFLAVIIISVIIRVLIFTKKKLRSQWKTEVEQELIKLIKSQKTADKNQLKLNLIEIDNLLDKSLRNKGVAGNTLAERLKNSQKYFTKDIYNKIWQGHKSRNLVVHNNDYGATSWKLKREFNKIRTGIWIIIN